MKAAKRIVCLMLALSLMFCTACTKTQSDANVIREQGAELVQLMQEMSKSDLMNQAPYNTNENWKALLETVTNGKYKQPQTVYRIQIDEQSIAEMIGYAGFDDLSPNLKDFMLEKIYASFASIINGKVGSNAIAVASFCTAHTSFVSEGVSENIICLFVYEDAPAAIVSFVVGSDHAVCANGFFVFDEDLDTSNIESVQAYFAKMNAQVEVLQ